MKRFRGLFPPVVTPIVGGEVDQVGIAALVEHTVGHLDGIVVGGSCGEGPSLGRSRRRQALLQFMNFVDGRIPVVDGVASTSLADIRELIAEGDGLGVAGYLVPPPFYFSNSPAGVSTFFAEVARTTDREVIIYDNPKTTKTTMTVELIASIVGESSNINHVKVTDPDLDKVVRLSQTCDATLLAGSDEVMHHQIVRGCEGAVTAAPQVFPRACRAWFDAARDPTEDAARALYDRLLPFVIELLIGPDQYPAVVKYALFRLGVISSDEVLPPLTPLDGRRRAEIGVMLESNALDVSSW